MLVIIIDASPMENYNCAESFKEILKKHELNVKLDEKANP